MHWQSRGPPPGPKSKPLKLETAKEVRHRNIEHTTVSKLLNKRSSKDALRHAHRSRSGPDRPLEVWERR
jgi:hypothetical protein